MAELLQLHYNPRTLLQKTLTEPEESLNEDRLWLCAWCYKCYERCPQDVRPIEVIIALKNMAVEKETAPANLAKLSENIAQTGVSVTVTSAVNRRRQELGLPELKTTPIEELKEILEDKDEQIKDNK